MNFIKAFFGIEKPNYKKYKKNQYEKNKIIEAKTVLNTKEIAEQFKTTPQIINKIFFELQWVEKKGMWTVVTDQGLLNGGEEVYSNTHKKKYVVWEESILKNPNLIQKIEETQNKKTTSNKEKEEKGKIYEEYVAMVYRSRGYHVTEYGKQKGREDHGIDLIAKKEKHLVLIQCKNWNKNTKWKIDHKDIKAFQTDARTFVEDKPLLRSCDLTARYTISGNFIHPSAIKHIEDMQKIGKKIDYEIIEING